MIANKDGIKILDLFSREGPNIQANFLSSPHKQWNYGHPALLFISYLPIAGLYRVLLAHIAWTTYRLLRAMGVASDGAGCILYLRIGVVGLLGARRASLRLPDATVRNQI